MNKIYKTVWNAVRRCLVAVNEATRSSAQARLSGSIVVLSIGTIFPLIAQAADWYPSGGIKWNVNKGTNTTYDNFYWRNTGGASNPWFMLAGNWRGGYTVSTMNITNNFEMTLPGGIFQISQPSGVSYSKGTLNVGGNVLIQNGVLHGASSVAGEYTSGDGILNVQGTTTIGKDGSLSAGYSSNQGTTYNVNFSLQDLIIESDGTFSSGSASNGHFNFTASIKSVLVKEGGTYSAHSGGNGLYTNVTVVDSMTFEKGSELINYHGLVLGTSKQNYLAIGNTLNLYGTTVTENMVLEQEQGAINITEGDYVFADFSQTGGVLNNGANVTFNDAYISSEGQLINTGSISFNGTSVLNKLIEGDGTVNIIGGTFITDHFENGSVNIQNGVATLNSLTDGVQHSMTGGELHTGVDEIFGSLGVMGDDNVNVISLNASVPEDIRTSVTEFFKKYVPGFVKENLNQYASFNGGKIVLKVDTLTETQVTDLQTAFKETFFHSKKERFPMLVPYRTSIGKRFYFLRTKKLLFIFKIFLGRNRLEIDIKRFKNMKESRKLGISFIAQSSIQPSASHPNFSGKLSNASGTRNITKCFFNKLPIACIFHKTRLKVKLTIVFIFQKILNVKRNQFFFCHLFNLQIFKQAFSFLNIRFLSTLIATNKQYHDFQISDGVIQPITWAIVNFGFAHAFSQRADLSKMAILHISYSSHDQLPCQSIFWFKRLEPFLESFSEFNDISHLINSLNVYHSIHKNNEVMYESNI